MTKEEKDLIYNMIFNIATQVENLKEKECGNSGFNWFQEFRADLLDKFINPTPSHQARGDK